MLGRRAAAVVAGLLFAWLPASTAVAADNVTQVCQFSDKRLTEISGMTMSVLHPDVLWLHNDSSGGPFIYAVDSTTCKTLARVRIKGIPARDIEAIASGRDASGAAVLWIADIGDNRDSWPFVRVHRVREPLTIEAATISARTFKVAYSDRPHNAEVLLADPNSPQLWIVTRQLAHGQLYALPAKLSPTKVNIAKPLRTEGGLITDGAVSPDGSRYVLRDYVNAVIYTGLPPGLEQQTILLPFQPQGEAVTWTSDGQSLLVAGERDDRLLRVDIADVASASASPNPQDAASQQAASGPESPMPESGILVPTVAIGLVLLAGAVVVIAEARRHRVRGG